MKLFFLILLSVVSLFANQAFITADELEQLLKEKNNIVLIDIGSKEDYVKGHIPNAQHTDILKWRQKVKLHNILRSDEELLTEMQRLGINNDSHVVIYGHNKKKEILKSSYVALALISQGMKEVSLLDGAYGEWEYDETRPIQITISPVQKGNFKPKVNRDFIVDKNFVASHLHQIPMLEARPPQFYYGTLRSQGVKRYGHIPGAMSSNWKDKFTLDQMLKSDAILKEIFVDGYHLKKDQEVLLYCTGGLEASMNWYILSQHMGFSNTKIYDASMREWGNLETTPVARYKWEMFE